jgi:hypothetical protein
MAMSDKVKGAMFTGARAKFSIQGVHVGYARNVAVTEEIEYQPVEILDQIQVEEFVPVAYRVRFTASMFRIVGETLKKQGWFPKLGQTSAEHLENILLVDGMVATIEDTKTGETFATLEQVKIASHNWTIDARGIVGEDVEFTAVRLRDETGD